MTLRSCNQVVTSSSKPYRTIGCGICILEKAKDTSALSGLNIETYVDGPGHNISAERAATGGPLSFDGLLVSPT